MAQRLGDRLPPFLTGATGRRCRFCIVDSGVARGASHGLSPGSGFVFQCFAMRGFLHHAHRRFVASPLIPALALGVLAALPVVLLLLGAARRSGDPTYGGAAVLVVVVHAAAAAVGGAVFSGARSWPLALAAALLVAVTGSRLLLHDLDPGGAELGAERFVTSPPVVVAMVLAVVIVSGLARARPASRAARRPTVATAAIVGVTVVVGLMAVTLARRTWVIQLPDDPLALERTLPRLAEEARQRPTTARVQRHFGIALLRAGRLDEAATVLARTTRLDRFDATAWSALGETQLSLHYYRDAVSSLRRAVLLDSTMAATWRALGGALLAATHPLPQPGAERAYRHAIRLDPDDPDTRFEYALFLDASRRDVEALEQLEQALALDSTRTDFHLTACMVHKRKVRLIDALHHCERARHLAPSDPEVWAELGTALYVAGELRRAEAAFATAARLRPGFFDRRPDLRDLWAATRGERDGATARPGGVP